MSWLCHSKRPAHFERAFFKDRSRNIFKNSLSKSKVHKEIRPKGGVVNKISKKAFKPIDQDEKDLMESIERDDWKPVKDFHAEKEKAISAARNTLKKRQAHQSPSHPKRLSPNSDKGY